MNRGMIMMSSVFTCGSVAAVDGTSLKDAMRYLNYFTRRPETARHFKGNHDGGFITGSNRACLSEPK